MFEQILTIFGTLAGFAALVSVLVNVLKSVGVVKDGTADKWVASFNLVGVVALFTVMLINPEFNPIAIDSVLSQIAVFGAFLFSTISTILGSKVTYLAIKGLPLVGTSNTPTELEG